MFRVSALAFLATVPAACLAAPISVHLTATEDAFVWEGAADRSHGLAGALSVAGPEAVNGAGEPQGIFHSFMKFDAATVADLDAVFGPAQWWIKKAVLTLTEDGDPRNPRFNRGAGAFEIRWIADDTWQEGTGGGNGLFPPDGVTYNTTLSFLGPGDASLGTAFHSGGVDGVLDFSLGLPGAFVGGLQAGGDVSLFLTAVDPDIGFTWNGKDFGNEAAWPVLSITADRIPEPASFTLGALGLGLLARHRRRAP